MTRHSSTYRKARRAEWKAHNGLDPEKLTWAKANERIKGWRQDGHLKFGNLRSRRAPFTGDRSKYMPHIGAKEQDRHALKEDGAMHLTPHEHRAMLVEVSRISFAHNTGRASL